MLYVMLAQHFFSTQTKAKKNCLSLAMAKKLVQVVLSISSFTWKGTINMIKYHLKRNDIAYKSHRKEAWPSLKN
jgi:hypothetical protein